MQVASASCKSVLTRLTCEELKSLLRAAGRRHHTKIDPLRGLVWSRCKNSRFFCVFCGACATVRTPAPGTGGSRVRFPPGPRAGFASERCNSHSWSLKIASFKCESSTGSALRQLRLEIATCPKKLAQHAGSDVETCSEQLAQGTCAMALAQRDLRRGTCAE